MQLNSPTTEQMALNFFLFVFFDTSSFLAREMPTLLVQMNTRQAIVQVIPIIRNFSLDPMDTVRESLASQLDKIVLYFYQVWEQQPHKNADKTDPTSSELVDMHDWTLHKRLFILSFLLMLTVGLSLFFISV